MSVHRLFLSYNRGPATTPAMERLDKRVRVQLKVHGVEPFFDQRSIAPGESWSDEVKHALAGATEFLAFVSIDYCLSEQCQRELETAVARYERERRPRLLFVLADALDPGDIEVDSARAVERLALQAPPARRLQRLGDINFLGPYNAAGRLVPLALHDPDELERQLAALVAAIKRLVA